MTSAIPPKENTLKTHDLIQLSVQEITKRCRGKAADDHIEVRRGRDRQWFVRIVSTANGETKWTSEGSRSKGNALHRASVSALAYCLPLYVEKTPRKKR